MNDPGIRPARIVPPGSTPVRELAHAVAAALTLPNDVTTQGELTYLRAARDRARVVLFAMRRVIADRELDDSDLMAVVATIRDQLADYGGENDPAGPFRVFVEAIIAALTISPCRPETTERAYLQSARARARREIAAFPKDDDLDGMHWQQLRQLAEQMRDAAPDASNCVDVALRPFGVA